MLQTQDLKVALDAELGLVKAIDGLTLAACAWITLFVAKRRQFAARRL